MLLYRCTTLFYCPPCLPHHQLLVSWGAVGVLVPEPGCRAKGQPSEPLQVSCSFVRQEVRVQLDNRYPLLLLFWK